MSLLLEQFNSEIASVVDEVKLSLVQISLGMGNGAGTIWHSDGLIITNAHVVDEQGRSHRFAYRYGYRPTRSEISVTLADGTSLPAKVLAQDTEHDIAALAVDARELPTIRLGDSRTLRPGQLVLAVGHPWGVMGAVTAGIVVGSGSELPEMPGNARDWIMMDLKVRPGNSGGPLVDAQGQLIGINTIMTGPQSGAAVPIHSIKRFLKEALGSPVTESLETQPAFQV
jgi:S1-C subfamily serine protease